jgi:hypothetical protein
VAWIAGLPSGATAEIEWDATLDPKSLAARLGNSSTPSSGDQSSLNVSRIVSLALEVLKLRPGDVRLVGTMKESPGQMRISPTASQLVSSNLVVWHLRYGQLPPPKPDVNLPGDVRQFQLPEEDFDPQLISDP